MLTASVIPVTIQGWFMPDSKSLPSLSASPLPKVPRLSFPAQYTSPLVTIAHVFSLPVAKSEMFVSPLNAATGATPLPFAPNWPYLFSPQQNMLPVVLMPQE
jgi:hypothetical protein